MTWSPHYWKRRRHSANHPESDQRPSGNPAPERPRKHRSASQSERKALPHPLLQAHHRDQNRFGRGQHHPLPVGDEVLLEFYFPGMIWKLTEFFLLFPPNSFISFSSFPLFATPPFFPCLFPLAFFSPSSFFFFFLSFFFLCPLHSRLIPTPKSSPKWCKSPMTKLVV